MVFESCNGVGHFFFFLGIELALIKPGIHLVGWKGLYVLDSELMGVFG